MPIRAVGIQMGASWPEHVILREEVERALRRSVSAGGAQLEEAFALIAHFIEDGERTTLRTFGRTQE